MHFGAPLGGEDGWERWSAEAEARPCPSPTGAQAVLVACLDTNFGCLGECRQPVPWQLAGTQLPAAFGLTGLGPLLPREHSPPLLCHRLPSAVPHPHSRQCRPAPAHTLVLPTLHLRAGCAERRRAEEGRHRQDAAGREDGAVLPARGARVGLTPPHQPAAVLLLLRRPGRVRPRGRGLPEGRSTGRGPQGGGAGPGARAVRAGPTGAGLESQAELEGRGLKVRKAVAWGPRERNLKRKARVLGPRR